MPAPSDGLEKFAVTPAGSPATDSCARPVNAFTPVLANCTISDAAPPDTVISSAGLATIWKSCSCLTVKVGPLAVPRAVVTVTAPLCAARETVAVSRLASALTTPAVTPPILIWLPPAMGTKPAPSMVTSVPGGPSAGEMPLITSLLPTVTSIAFEEPATGSTTLTGTVPGAVNSAAGTSAVRFTELPKVVASVLAPKRTLDAGVKLAPPRARVSALPTSSTEGVTALRIGVAGPTVNRRLLESPPADAGLRTSTGKDPGEASSAAGRSALKRVELMKRVLSGVLSKTTLAAGSKRRPSTARTSGPEPATAVFGWRRVSAGLSESREPARTSTRRGALRAPR
ncbi:MAG: hypothetical protein AW09_001934 [Candidatus Accumulibacter phosphatis]|uniref:Uncharacterized protein n=1 Tax=Candidatus Accumulibacter phosphatis TaxID=327160 RepID=A0A080LY84_9PROT|nr:MAG: hypothetical protein AW09_001934 [Candidatus Accumulibacter phosphatis]